MKTKIKFILFVLIISISIPGCKKDNVANKFTGKISAQDTLSNADIIPDDTTYISLLVNFYDAAKNERRNEILIIGKYYNDKFIPFEDYLEEPGKINNSLTAKILNRVKTFTAFYKGVKLAEFHIEGMSSSEFSCTANPTGRVKMQRKFSDFLPTSKQNYSGFSDGKEVDYSFNYYLAINNSTKSFTSQQVQPLDSSISTEEQAAIEKCILKEFVEKDKNNIGPVTRKDYSVSLYKLGINEDKFYIITYHHDTDSLCFSNCHILTFDDNNNIDEKLAMTNINEIDSWGDGYKLFDVLDIDGDGLPEVIFEIGYYESTGFEIYKLKNGKFQKVMEVVPWGC